MGGAHHAEPLVGGGLARGDDLAHTVDQDLGAPAGQRVVAGGPQAREGLVEGDPRDVADVHDLRRRQGVQVDRVARLDVGEEVLVPLDPQVRVVAPLEQQGRAAQVERLLDLAEDHRLRQDVALGVHRRPVEGAEVAVGDAEVGVVDVPVDHERHDVRVAARVAHPRRRLAHGHEVPAGQEREGVVVRRAARRRRSARGCRRRASGATVVATVAILRREPRQARRAGRSRATAPGRPRAPRARRRRTRSAGGSGTGG